MDEKLSALMKKLGDALNEAISDSENVADIIAEIKRTGYDVFIVLEATVGFNKRRQGRPEKPPVKPESRINKQGKANLDLTGPDQAFFRALKISVEE